MIALCCRLLFSVFLPRINLSRLITLFFRYLFIRVFLLLLLLLLLFPVKYSCQGRRNFLANCLYFLLQPTCSDLVFFWMSSSWSRLYWHNDLFWDYIFFSLKVPGICAIIQLYNLSLTSNLLTSPPEAEICENISVILRFIPTRDHIQGGLPGIPTQLWHLPQVVPRVVQTTGSVHPQPTLPNW